MSELPLPVRVLGPAGLLPQIICIALVLFSPWPIAATIAGLSYAALILSFLGGMWWMAGVLIGSRAWWFFAMAVLPSLLGWGAIVASLFGDYWTDIGLAIVGVSLLLSPLGDRVVGGIVQVPRGWMVLRIIMAVGLGGLTLALAVL